MSFVKWCEEEKCKENGTIIRNTYLANCWVDFLQGGYVESCTYMVRINYVNLIEIGLAVIEIQAVENGKLLVPVNNTLMHHTAFLASDT